MSTPVRVGTFNLYQYAAPGSHWYDTGEGSCYTPAEWDEKRAWIRAQIQSVMKADVVAFQEVFSVDDLRALTAEAGLTHFAHAGTPGAAEIDGRIVYHRPVVALASRYPILEHGPLDFPADLDAWLPLQPGADFARPPLRALVDLPGFGPTAFYTGHLKSQRPAKRQAPLTGGEGEDEVVRALMLTEAWNKIHSLLQRGAEAAALYHRVVEGLAAHPDRPAIVLGDLNADDEAVAIDALLGSPPRWHDGAPWRDQPESLRQIAWRYRLYDAWEQAGGPGERPATHAYRSRGVTLDHLLVSDHLNLRNPERLGELRDYQVHFGHYREIGPGAPDPLRVDRRLRTDHGLVSVALAPVDPGAAPAGEVPPAPAG